MPDPQSAAVTYSSYLRIDDLLACQAPRSDEHDEMLFIVIHQVYELWFKQLLHELRHLQQELEAGTTGTAMHTLKRVLAILKTVVAQIDVLETLTPIGFLSFRDRLAAASGFQSAQFRELEALLGRRDESMLTPYAQGTPERARIEAAMRRPPLFDSLLAYLATRGHEDPDVEERLIAVYRTDNEAAEVCERLVDVDEGFQEWRYRHVKMVERTIGTKPGTGGSAGAEYLRSTLFRPAFPPLWGIRSRL